ncbi:hypothetical protein DVH24_038004 [Malus domestica]|uniref:Uncharacterized protein n=1 Tax=Malus domestica TaxID=3750 RepID=A0A498K638_MALDO|nr:hypothetical protein DVH24_038004 [Malus domestica]
MVCVTSRACSTTVTRYCPLWAYHSLTVLFLRTHDGSPILEVLWPHSRFTSEFLRNPKPVASFALYFRVPTELEASELPKGLVLGSLFGRCGILQSTPLRGPTSSSAHFQPGIGSDTICHIPAGSTTFQARSTTVARYCPFWAYLLLGSLSGRCGMLQSTPLRGPTSSSAHFQPGIGSDTICHIPAGSTTFRVHSTTVTRYCPLWAYHSLTILFLGTHEQLPSGSPILRVLWLPSRLTSEFLRKPKPVSSQKASC